MNKKIYWSISIIVYVAIIITLISNTIVLCRATSIGDTHMEPYEYVVYRSYAELDYCRSKSELVSAIDNYIDSVYCSGTRKEEWAIGKSIKGNLNGLALLNMCDAYNIDIRFVLAQAQIESHFGAAGIAAKTNSPWNVMAVDGTTADKMINDGHAYSHPDHSIEPYLKLLKKSYLVNGKTEYDMLDKYVTDTGKRYASNKNYEMELKSAFKYICEETEITNLYQRYKEAGIILGKS